ncbi:hypothetical protein L2E82_51609 [Cichorium intybus]|nr:hypothetical protein L2E82_51609 [Cichorium intybus]
MNRQPPPGDRNRQPPPGDRAEVQSPIRAAQPPQVNEPLEGLNEFQQFEVNNKEAASPETLDQVKDGTTDIPIVVNPQAQDKGPMAGSKPKKDFGPVQDLVPLGCFGPFPGNWTDFSNNKTDAQVPLFNSRVGSKSKQKKRNRDKSGPRNTSPTIRISLKKRLHSQTNTLDFTSSPPTSPSILKSMDTTSGKPNTGVPPDIPITLISHPKVETSIATEADNIAEIGQAVGFQIEPGNPALIENAEDNGEHIGIQ